MTLPLLLATALAVPPGPCPAIPLAQGDDEGWTGVLDEASFAALHELKEGEAPDLAGEDVEVGGMDCYLSLPEHGEPVGAVIVIHEWWGLNAHVKHWADRLAADGYAALAVDLYGGTVATTREEAMAAMGAVEAEPATEKLRAAHAWLVDDEGPVAAERTACIGWCFGGAWSLNLAIAEPELDAAVLYYGRLVTDRERLAEIEAPVLAIFGEQDPSIPMETVDAFASAMKAAKRPLTLRTYDAAHAFANPSSARYDAEHAGAAWLETRSFLAQHLFPAPGDGAFHRGTRDLAFDAPDGWDEGDEAPMRLATLNLSATTTCVISAFPGDVGGLEANVQRWLGQVGEEPMDADEIEGLPRIAMFGRLAPVLHAEGRLMSRGEVLCEDGAVLIAFCQLEDETVIVKLQGERAEVEGAAGRFVGLCRSLR